MIEFDNLKVSLNLRKIKRERIDIPRKTIDNRVGLVNYNKFGSKMTIVEYHRCDNVVVQFEDGYKCRVTFQAFENGEVKSVYEKRICGIGFQGEGEFQTRMNKNSPTPEYDLWSAILTRCYSEVIHKKQPRYTDCKVDSSWYNFQNFARWYSENHYTVEGEVMNLDKDILVKGNKIYSPDTCVFVPMRINLLFTKTNAKRGDYPIGVSYYKSSNNFVAHCNDFDFRKKTIGYYHTVEEAFNAYKTFKENVIKQVADHYKDKIPLVLYEALYNYEVEITD